MKHMTKKLFSLLLCLALTVGLCSAGAMGMKDDGGGESPEDTLQMIMASDEALADVITMMIAAGETTEDILMMIMSSDNEQLQDREITEDLVLEAGEYEENLIGNGCTVTLKSGAKYSGAVTGIRLVMESGSKWTVTGSSELSYLELAADSVIAGSMGKAATMTLDGVIAILKAGETYEGDVRVYSGDMSYPFYITVASGAMTADEDAEVEFEGEITENGISSFYFSSLTHGMIDITGRTEEPFVLGGKTANYDASDLDILPAAQEKLGFVSFDSRIQGWTAPAVCVTGSAYVLAENLYVNSDYHPIEIGGNETADGDTIMVYRNCYLSRETFTGEDIADCSWCHTTSLFARGNVRISMSVGNSQTYYYGTAAVVDGWSAFATDAGGQTGVDMMVYNSFACNLLGGYGTYSDTGCRVYLYGTDFLSAEFGGIIANNGEIYITDTDEAQTDTNTLRAEVGAPYQSMSYETLEPLAYAQEDDLVAQNTASAILGFRNGIMMHVPDLSKAGGRISDKQGVLYVKNATVGTSLVCAPEDWADGGYQESWILKTDEANWAWIEHTIGSAILVRSDNAVIKLTNANVVSWTNVLFQSILNNDGNGNFIAADEEVADHVGIWLTADGDTALVGDILHEDYQRTMYITLADSASLTGDIFTGTVDDWHAVFADYADCGTNYYRDVDGYDKIWGTYVTLEPGTVWTVTGESNITGLTIMDGAQLSGLVTIDGVVTEIEAGVSYEGDIRITAVGAATASGGPS